MAVHSSDHAEVRKFEVTKPHSEHGTEGAKSLHATSEQAVDGQAAATDGKSRADRRRLTPAEEMFLDKLDNTESNLARGPKKTHRGFWQQLVY